jgi:hypothetical protein
MVKKVISASLIGAMFLLNSCGDQEAVDRLEAQQSLDKGDYEAAIASLESKTNKTDEDKMVLASAYMGKSGFSFSNTLSIVANATSGNENDTFASFAAEVEAGKNSDTLTNLQNALDYYVQVGLSGVSAAPAYKSAALASANDTGDKDLFLGLAYLIKSTVVISYLGNIDNLQNSGVIGNNLTASSCAITKVYTNTLATGCSSVTSVVDGNYTRLEVILDNGDGITYKRLANLAGDQVLLSDYKDTSATPSPIKINGQDVTIENALVSTINYGFTNIVDAAPEDTKKDIYQFKRDIIGNQNLSDESVATTNITVTQLADYLITLDN